MEGCILLQIISSGVNWIVGISFPKGMQIHVHIFSSRAGRSQDWSTGDGDRLFELLWFACSSSYYHLTI